MKIYIMVQVINIHIDMIFIDPFMMVIKLYNILQEIIQLLINILNQMD